MAQARDDFKAGTKRLLQDRVASRCSNPDCRCATIGPQQGGDKTLSLGEAAHICAAAAGGPRYDPNMTPEERSSFDNGIWLCRNCAAMIDRDEKKYTVVLLHQWKDEAEKRASEDLTGGSPVKKPRFQVDFISSSGGLSSSTLRLTNVSSLLVSDITSIKLYAEFTDHISEVQNRPHIVNTILDRGKSTDVFLNNGFFGEGQGICMTNPWQDFRFAWCFSCIDEDGHKYTYEAWVELPTSNGLPKKLSCDIVFPE